MAQSGYQEAKLIDAIRRLEDAIVEARFLAHPDVLHLCLRAQEIAIQVLGALPGRATKPRLERSAAR
jgi:hypothetical protein